MPHYLARLLLLTVTLFFAACAKDTVHKMVVSIPEQKMVVYRRDVPIRTYDVSTSKFCISDRPGSNGTPLGLHEIAKKIGGGHRSGMKFSGRRPTGEIVKPNTPGRDPIVSRILWLKGLERSNRHSFGRTIYIHGTPEEWRIGHPVSYGCIRMRSSDVIELYGIVGVGAKVDIINRPLPIIEIPIPKPEWTTPDATVAAMAPIDQVEMHRVR